MSVLLGLMLAAAVVEGPCAEVARAVADDATVNSDSRLREAAALAEAAGDFAQARALLQRLRDRSRNPGVQAEAQDALTMLPTTPPAPCSTQSRRVWLVLDEGLFLEPWERAQLQRAVGQELSARDVEILTPPSPTPGAPPPPDGPGACADERCVRTRLFGVGAGALLRLSPTRVGPIVTVTVDVIGFKGQATYTVDLDADAARWSPVLPPGAIDDLDALLPVGRRRLRHTEEPVADDGVDADPIIAGVSLGIIGALIGTGGVVVAAAPELLVDVTNDEDLLRTVGVGTAVGGYALAVGGVIAVALIVDSQNSLEPRSRSGR